MTHPTGTPTPPIPPRTASQRQAARRARLAANGHRFFTVSLTGPTAEVLQTLAQQRRQPVARILELGVLLARKALDQNTP